MYVVLVQGVPHLRGFHYRGSHYRDIWLIYVQVGGFRVSRGPPTVLVNQMLCDAFFSSPKIQVRRRPSLLYVYINEKVFCKS